MKNFDYFLLKLDETLQGRDKTSFHILDAGCGKGELIDFLRQKGYTVWGYEIKPEEYWPGECVRHPYIKYSGEDKAIPYESAIFDLVIANQVIEHVADLSLFLKEAHRVLKPKGCLIATFPLKSSIIEQHCFSPFAHWLPAGRTRQLWIFLTSHRKAEDPRHLNTPHLSSLQRRRLSAKIWDDYLQKCCHYRTSSEIMKTGQPCFPWVTTDRNNYASYLLSYFIKKITGRTIRKFPLPKLFFQALCVLVNDSWIFTKGSC